ncbi:MAG: 2-iminoacetate synthase ThiH [Breznakibacter sp.]
MTFYPQIGLYDWDEVAQSIRQQTRTDVERVLANGVRKMDDLKALLSPEAVPVLEILADTSRRVTRQRFGNVVQLYVPLYLSNFCENCCVYCGFNAGNRITRKVLSMDELARELSVIRRNPFQHLLLVAGEAPRKAGIDYLEEAVILARKYFHQVSIEVQPLAADEYARLANAGLYGVYVYQETYHEKAYPNYHLGGKKTDFRYRLETPDRIGQAGIRKIGLGNLIGLEDWRTEAFFTALHLSYLRKKYWRSKLSVSFPRLRPHAGNGFQPQYSTSERDLVQLICAYRLFDHDLEISLSTRESAHFRDNVFPLGVTAMSAGSKTGPGGYGGDNELEQFAVNDDRLPREVADAIRQQGFEPVWKDWADCLQVPQGADSGKA